MSILDGMESLGLGHLKDAEIYAQPDAGTDSTKKNTEKAKNAPQESKPEETEESFLYLKDYECPVCGDKFKATVVKTGKARLLKQDKDLRPIYKGVDSHKYDVVHCNKCGYAVISKYYGPLAKPHKELLKQNIASKYKPMEPVGLAYHYEEAFMKYKLALVNAVCRQAKDSEKAYICLKTAWMLRGMQEHHEEVFDVETYSLEKLKDMEDEYLKEAFDGFIKARQSEAPPIAGMNEITLDYLLAVLSLRFDDFEDAVKLLQGIISSSQAGNAQKDKARELVLELKEKIKKSKSQ